MRCRLWMLLGVSGLAGALLVGEARAQEKKQPPPVPKKLEPKKESKPKDATAPGAEAQTPQIPIGWGTPYSAGPPAYGWGYGWGNPWQPTWGGQGAYNFQPYYEPTVIPVQTKVVYFVHPPHPFVSVHQLPGGSKHSGPQSAARSVPVPPGVR